MNRALRALAVTAAAVALLSACSLPFEIVPRGESDPSPSTVQETPPEALPTEETKTEAEVATSPVEDEPTDTDGDGKTNYSLTPDEVFPALVDLCNLPDEVLADGGRTLILDTPGTEPDSGTLTVEESGCAIGYLNPPDWLMQQIESTKLDGTREKAVDGYLTYSWTISNEKGLDFVVRVSDEEA